MNNMMLALPEIVLACAGMILLLFGTMRSDKTFGRVTALGALALIVTGYLVTRGEAGLAMSDMFAVDGFRTFAKVLVLVAAALSLGLSPASLQRTQSARPEYPVLVVFATLGMMLMISAHDLIALYMGLELQNLALYVLVSFRRDDLRSNEAGLKYFTLGALSSAILLFGLSLVYGFAGTTAFEALSLAITQGAALKAGLAVGIAFVIAGFAFKISAVPFHMWTPDVYEGAPTSVTAFLAAAPKVAALALVAAVLAQPFSGAASLWTPIVMVLSVASMLVGSIGGLLQTNIKRLMAYSAIANVGTMLVGLVVVGEGAAGNAALMQDGLQSVLLYLCFYVAGTLGVFGSMLVLRQHGQAIEETQDLAGLSRGHPLIALVLAASLFSLAGIPPLAGFFGKYFVLLAAVKAGLSWLALVGVMASVIAAGYYLRLVKLVYFDARKGLPLDAVSERIPATLATIAALAVVGFILIPSPLIEQAYRAAQSLVVP